MKSCPGLMALVFLLASPLTAVGAEPDEGIRPAIRMYAALEANDLKSYCAEMQSASYAGYLTRVCQSAVQHKLKQAEDCAPERIAQQAKTDVAQCQAMTPAEFKEKVRLGREGRNALFKEMAAQGIDGEKLLEAEQRRARELKRMQCCAKPVPEKRTRAE